MFSPPRFTTFAGMPRNVPVVPSSAALKKVERRSRTKPPSSKAHWRSASSHMPALTRAPLNAPKSSVSPP
jgi:hypothetical protein